MAVGYQTINNGTVLGDHTGDDGRTFTQKCKEMFSELFGQATNSYFAATVTAASTDNYDPWGAAPPQDFRLDITPSTNDIAFTGLRAGFDGQRGEIYNVGTTYAIALNNQTTSTAANRFYGQGDAAIPPGACQRVCYSSLPTPRWRIG